MTRKPIDGRPFGLPLVFGLVLALLLVQGCGWGKAGSPVGESLLEAKTYDRYAKVVALVVFDRTGIKQEELIQQLREILVKRLQKKMGKGLLVKQGDPDFPDYLEEMPTTDLGTLDNMALAQEARLDGFQALVIVSLESFVPLSEKKGMFWWRRDRFYMLSYLMIDVFDPVTAARLLRLSEEVKVRVDQDDYDYFGTRDWMAPDSVEEALLKRANAVAKKVAKALDKFKWQVTLAAVEDDQVALPAGKRAGVAPGDRLAVFGIQRVITGVQGESFVVPGFRKGQLVVEKVFPAYCRARAQGPVQVGDIAVPVR